VSFVVIGSFWSYLTSSRKVSGINKNNTIKITIPNAKQNQNDALHSTGLRIRKPPTIGPVVFFTCDRE
jgi:hypothetical protein